MPRKKVGLLGEPLSYNAGAKWKNVDEKAWWERARERQRKRALGIKI